LFLRYFQALAPPYPEDTFVVYTPTVSTKKRRDPLIAVAPVADSKINYCCGQRALIIAFLRLAPLRRAVLTKNAASPAFGNAELFNSAIDAGAPARGR
jgi:hypothetical protein